MLAPRSLIIYLAADAFSLATSKVAYAPSFNFCCVSGSCRELAVIEACLPKLVAVSYAFDPKVLAICIIPAMLNGSAYSSSLLLRAYSLSSLCL